MAEKKREAKPLLSHHQGRRFDTAEIGLERHPLVYGPRYEPTVNVERLPEPSQLEGMELAYREQPQGDAELLRITERLLSENMMAAMFVSLVFVIVLPIMPWQALLGIAAATSLAMVFRAYLRSAFSFLGLMMALFMPLLVAVMLKGLALLIALPVILAAVLAIMTVIYFAEYARRPFRFYRRWLYTAPHLKPSSRKQEKGSVPQPAMLILIGLLAAAVLVPLVSNWLAIVGIIVGALAWIGGNSMRLSWQRMKDAWQELGGRLRHVFAHYLNYGKYSSRAAGVWYPEHSVTDRRQTLFLMCVLPTLTLAIALDGFLPWDMPLVAGKFREVCLEDIATDPDVMEMFQWLTPHFEWKGARPLPEYIPAQRLPRAISEDIRSTSRREITRKYNEALEDYNRAEEKKQFAEYQERVWPQFKEVLDSAAYVPVLVAGIGLVYGHISFVWLLALAIALTGVIPILLIVATLVPLIKDASLHAEKVESLDKDDRPEWQWYIDRVRSSKHEATGPLGEVVQEGEHLFLGVEPEADFPVLLDKQILSEHAYLVGDSGSGKTSLGLMPMLTQLIRGDTDGSEQQATENGKVPPPPPMVILDLKGDIALFNSVRQEVENRCPKNREAFMYFTPEQGLDSCYFNPFGSLMTEKRSLLQLCQLLLDSLGLNHGEGYGRSYYSRQSRQMLFRALSQEPQPQSIEALYERLTDKSFTKDLKDTKDVFELLATIEALAQYPQLAVENTQASQHRVIHMPRVLEQGQVVYFWLPAALESVTVREIGKLALFSLLTAAIDRQRAGKPKRQAYLVIDEFQRIASENFKIILEQARSFGIAALLSNQTRSDLKLHDVDLRTTVNTNTRYKQFFSVTDPSEAAELVEMSGEEISMQMGWSDTATEKSTFRWVNNSLVTREETQSATESRTEIIKPKLMKNDILQISDHPLDSLLHISRGNGYSQFGGACIHLRSIWPMSKGAYDDLSEQAWPNRAEADATGETAGPEVVQADQTPSEVEQAGQEKAMKRWEAALAKVYEKNLPKKLEE